MNFIDLQEILYFNRPIYAHMEELGNKKKETLPEHTALCEKYFLRLLEKKKMKSSLLRLERGLLSGFPEEILGWFRRLTNGIITFHDAGKINPLFQSIKMKNESWNGMAFPSLAGSKHSLLSAAIYLDFFLADLEKSIKDLRLEKSKLVWLYEILLYNAYVIARHHSSMGRFYEFLQELNKNGDLFTIWESMDEGDYEEIYKGRFSRLKSSEILRRINQTAFSVSERQKYAAYIYVRLMLSLLTACDYYATSEYKNGKETVYFGSADEIREMRKFYENTNLVQSIRRFKEEGSIDDGFNINHLRNRIFLEAEEKLEENKDSTLFFLEAPTGSGKSNMAVNISFQLLQEDLDKIVYVYPFNNLVEQNKTSLKEIFAGTEEYEKIAVINSITPIRMEAKKKREGEEYPEYYEKALLDRQFLNYPFLLTTHVNLFQTMFGTDREAVFGFHQLTGSVLVLDEIQSYKNTIWTEIIHFLQHYGEFLNCKILIMSATLPSFELLTGERENMVRLLVNRDLYFNDRRFKDRVNISYELLRPEFSGDDLYAHIKKMLLTKKKVMIEFIKKDLAYEFYDRFCQDEDVTVPVERMTGDDNSIDREEILRKVKDEELCRNGFLLIATQVVEAGIDIDMDIGYKNISLLDSEEQFMGRINRNCRREGRVFFFKLSDGAAIYSGDYRMNKEFTLENPQMRSVLDEKSFDIYYKSVMELLKSDWNGSYGKEGYAHFMEEEMGKLDFPAIEERMKLIKEDSWDMSVYLARTIQDSEGLTIDGKRVWEEYKALLSAPPENYAKFRIQLSEIRNRLNYFIYKIRKNSNLLYNDRIGELYYIENGEEYFENGRLNRKKLLQEGAMFLAL